MIFIFWSMLSLQYVPAERLTSSTVPHMLTARKIFGETGRIVMGIAVISGVCGAVNMLFHLTLASFSELSDRNLLPGHSPGKLRRRRFILIFSFMIGVFLYGGLAGKEVLETYIQAALLLWLFFTGMQCLAASRLLKRYDTSQAWIGLGLGIFYILMTLFLTAAHDRSTDIFRFLFIVIATTTGISALWLRQGPTIEITHNNSDNTGGVS
jgi:hypothetical protein